MGTAMVTAMAQITAIITMMMATSIRATTAMAEMHRLHLTAAFLLLVAAAAPASAQVRCPTEADLDNGIRFAGGLDNAEFVVRRLTEQEMVLGELPPSLRTDYRVLTYGIPDKVNSGAVTITYRGLFDSFFGHHLGGGHFSYAKPVETLFPLNLRDRRREVDFIWRVPTEAGLKPSEYTEAARGTLTLEAVAEINIIIGGCTFETILVKASRTMIFAETYQPTQPQPDAPFVYWRYYVPSLGIWLAEVSFTEEKEIWIEGMYDAIEYLKPGEAELFE